MGRGEGGYIRIQNNSSIDVEIKIVEGRNVDDMGMDKIAGSVAPGEQLPTSGKERFEGSGGGVYQYIEGEVRNRFQKDGFFHLEAHPSDGTSSSQLTLKVDKDSWESKDSSPDADSSVKLVADVDEEDGDWKIELRVFDNYNPKNWMEEYGAKHGLGEKPLNQVGLPGTHDSGTYKFDKDKGASPDSGLDKIEDILDHGRLLGSLNDMILSTVFERLCQCQDKSVQQQLEAGIRYFDLRVAYHAESDSYMTCHGVYCVDMTEILQEMVNFLNEHPKEIVILEFKKLYAMEAEHKTALGNMATEALGDKVANSGEFNQKTAVQDFWDKGCQAVVIYKDRPTADKSEGKLWPMRCIDSPWPNANKTTVLHEKLKEKVETHEHKHLFVTQGILTPDTELIKQEIMNGGGLSIKKISEKCGGKVVDWVEEDWKPKQCLNIVIVDFFQNCSLIPAIINYNRTG